MLGINSSWVSWFLAVKGYTFVQNYLLRMSVEWIILKVSLPSRQKGRFVFSPNNEASPSESKFGKIYHWSHVRFRVPQALGSWAMIPPRELSAWSSAALPCPRRVLRGTLIACFFGFVSVTNSTLYFTSSHFNWISERAFFFFLIEG